MDFKELVISYKRADPTIWVSMKPKHRQCFTLTMLQEFLSLLDQLDKYGSPYRDGAGDVKYLVIKSEHPELFNTGGDLLYFSQLIQTQNRQLLMEYATTCIKLIQWGLSGGDRSITTIACVAGNALGGGFETVLSCQYIIAERQSSFSFPETLFGLFPGMGGYTLFSRYVGQIEANRAVCTGKRYSATELAELSVIYTLANRHEAELETEKFIKERLANESASLAVQKLKARLFQSIYQDLNYNTELWVESAMQLTQYDIKKIQTLLKRQERKFVAENKV